MMFKRVRAFPTDFEGYRMIEEAYGQKPDLLIVPCPTCGEQFFADKNTSALVAQGVAGVGGFRVSAASAARWYTIVCRRISSRIRPTIFG